MVYRQPSAFENFLSFHSHECIISDYGHSPISFKSLEEVYGQWYFIVFELKEKIKVFYLKGSKEKFERRIDELLVVQSYYYYNDYPKPLSIGWIPALFTMDFSDNELIDAIRIDFLKHGQRAYETGDNLIGNLYIAPRFFKSNEYSRSRYLDFDYSKWILKNRKKSSKVDD